MGSRSVQWNKSLQTFIWTKENLGEYTSKCVATSAWIHNGCIPLDFEPPESVEKQVTNESRVRIEHYYNYPNSCIDIKKATPQSRGYDTAIEVVSSGTMQQVLDNRGKRIGILDAASFCKPCVGFLGEVSTQETNMCMSSNLANVLYNLEGVYKYNKANVNKGLYTDSGIYLTDVAFIDRDDKVRGIIEPIFADVFVCSPPNAVAAKGNKVTHGKRKAALQARIDFALKAFSLSNVDYDVLVLCSFGCGQSGNMAPDIASMFKDLLSTKYKGVFKHVIFSVPVDGSYVHKCFNEIFKG